MQTLQSPIPLTSRCRSLRVAAALLSLSASAMAATSAASSEIEARYAQDRAKCLSGMSNQDRATCLKEAGAARAAARQGQLDDAGASKQRNAKMRCDALTGDDAKDCRSRMDGNGTVSGSVEAGGVLRETVTTQITPVVPPASAPTPAVPASATSAR